MKKTKLYSIISHTHWDREWYLPFEAFRIRLVELMDNLLDILERDKNYRFHLDAQTIVLEDYLEIRKSRRPDIERFVKEGRLLIGPWYVQNDFHLTSGEATVRNLIIGRKIASSFGACMEMGYAADQFGLISQLPQILNGFGIDTCVFGRGYGRGERQFYWESEDGSRLLCEHMANWYNNLQRLPSDPSAAYGLIKTKAEMCFENAKGSAALLMNGVDHLEAQEDLTEIIEGVRPLLGEGEEIIQDTLPEYMSRLKAEIEALGLELKCYTGEMRDGGQRTVLTGTASSRIRLKQQNVRTQSRIEGRFEPKYAYLSALGLKDHPSDYSEYIWKTLIQNHPHDSICGCSVDAVHRHMEDRTVRLSEVLTELETRADECYMSHLDRTRIPENAFLITCFSGSAYKRKSVHTATVDLISSEDTGCFTLRDEKGKTIPFEVRSIEKEIPKQSLSPINLPGTKTVNRYVIAFSLTLGGTEKKTLIGIPCEGSLSVTENARHRTRNLENEHLRVRINRNGTLDITDKATGAVIRNACLIEDNSDNDDMSLYCYKLGSGDDIVTSKDVRARVETVLDTRLEKSVRVSFTVSVERGGKKNKLPVELLITLRAGARRLEIEATVDNSYPYHRVRAIVPTGIVTETHYAGQPFDIVERKQVSDYGDDEMHPCTGFVGVENGERGVALLTEGLYEYEHTADGGLAVTLLRCAEDIGRYLGGPLNPDGQCIGRTTVKFAIYPYSGDRLTAGVPQEADDLISGATVHFQHYDSNKLIGGRPFVQAAGVPVIFYRPLEHPETVIPLSAKAFDLTQNRENAMMLSAYKCSEDGKGQIIRLYNTAEKNVEFTLRLGYKIKRAYLVDLAEETVSELSIKGGRSVTLSAHPKQIITVKVEK